MTHIMAIVLAVTSVYLISKRLDFHDRFQRLAKGSIIPYLMAILGAIFVSIILEGLQGRFATPELINTYIRVSLLTLVSVILFPKRLTNK